MSDSTEQADVPERPFIPGYVAAEAFMQSEAERTRLAAALREKDEALRKYGRHDTNCAYWGDGRCTCGYGAALRSAATTAPRKPTADSSQ